MSDHCVPDSVGQDLNAVTVEPPTDHESKRVDNDARWRVGDGLDRKQTRAWLRESKKPYFVAFMGLELEKQVPQ